jgi:hypothetical protein
MHEERMANIDVAGPASRICLFAFISSFYKLGSEPGPGRAFFSKGEEDRRDG